MENVKEVSEGAEVGDCDGGFVIGGHASLAADVGEVEIERVYREGDEAGDEEDMVPKVDNVAAGIQDPVSP